MRKLILLLGCSSFLFLPMKAYSQNIENANFDSLCICAIDRIWDWVSSDTYYFINDTAQPHTPNTFYGGGMMDVHMVFNTAAINYDDDSIHAMNSVKIFTRPDLVYPDGEKFRGFLANGNHFYTDNNGWMDFRKGGSPFPYRPYSMKGMYKFEDSLSMIDEYGKAIVLLKKYDSLTNTIDTVGYAESTIELNPTMVWSPFELIIDYYNSAIPDSVVVIFASSSMGSDPTTLWVDDISFEYVTKIEESPRNDEISIFPNPCSDILFISNGENENLSYRISSIDGTLIKNGLLSNRISLANFQSGIYVLTIIRKGQIVNTLRIAKLKME
ncbi:MAG: T9SS type A sorting domain-containing protein [Bacteroidales bacterium]|nr:T9SS type A sorting domain-containing protein [Bacteroidales bacterium]MCF8458288.1 T9SS type A sorting domain-containing protein [Bacteroidales bacterium]